MRACRKCGCTQNDACVDSRGPCWWVEDDLCSHCQPTPAPEGIDPVGMRWRLADGSFATAFGSEAIIAGQKRWGLPDQRFYDDDQMAGIERRERHWRKNHDHVVQLNKALRREMAALREGPALSGGTTAQDEAIAE